MIFSRQSWLCSVLCSFSLLSFLVPAYALESQDKIDEFCRGKTIDIYITELLNWYADGFSSKKVFISDNNAQASDPMIQPVIHLFRNLLNERNVSSMKESDYFTTISGEFLPRGITVYARPDGRADYAYTMSVCVYKPNLLSNGMISFPCSSKFFESQLPCMYSRSAHRFIFERMKMNEREEKNSPNSAQLKTVIVRHTLD